jgi:hypothetical protein
VALQLTHVLAELEEHHRGDQFRGVLGGKLPAGPNTPNAERAAGLKYLERRRLEGKPAVIRDERGESWGCAMVAIPLLDYAVLKARNPELVCKDRETRNRAWFKLFRELGGKYGCDASIGKTKRNAGVIVK